MIDPESAKRPEAMARLAKVRLACACGWRGGYADMAADPARCPSCKSATDVDREEPPIKLPANPALLRLLTGGAP